MQLKPFITWEFYDIKDFNLSTASKTYETWKSCLQIFVVLIHVFKMIDWWLIFCKVVFRKIYVAFFKKSGFKKAPRGIQCPIGNIV